MDFLFDWTAERLVIVPYEKQYFLFNTTSSSSNLLSMRSDEEIVATSPQLVAASNRRLREPSAEEFILELVQV